MAKEVKRMKYFDGLFLKEQEFNLEQNYHIRMRRLHNRYLHSWGIVRELGDELEVVKVDNEKAVKVRTGMALLPPEQYSEDGYAEEVSKEIILTEENIVYLDDPNYLDKNVYIFISYSDVETDAEKEKGGDTKIHWEEKAVIEHSLNILENKVILARVVIGDNNVTVHDTDLNELPLRKYAGFSDKILVTENEIQVNSPLTINGQVKAASFEGDGSQLTGISKNALDAADGDPVNAVYVDNAGNVGINTISPSARLDVGDGNLVVLDSGNVGIGQSNPDAKLDVGGNLKISGSLDINGNCNMREQLANQITQLIARVNALEGIVFKLKITGFDYRPPAVTGDSVGILGENFDPITDNNTVLFFGGVGTPRIGAVVRSATSERLDVIVPNMALTGTVTVEVNGQIAESEDDIEIFLPPPTLPPPG